MTATLNIRDITESFNRVFGKDGTLPAEVFAAVVGLVAAGKIESHAQLDAAFRAASQVAKEGTT